MDSGIKDKGLKWQHVIGCLIHDVVVLMLLVATAILRQIPLFATSLKAGVKLWIGGVKKALSKIQ
jgi:hypothetical protein